MHSSNLINKFESVGIKNIKPYSVRQGNKQKHYYSGQLHTGTAVFIKAGGSKEAVIHEFNATKYIQDLTTINATRVLSYHIETGINFLVLNF